MPNYRYSNEEYLNMVVCYRDSGEVVTRGQTLYQERYGSRPSARTILGAIQRHQKSGEFQPRVVTGRPPRYPAHLDQEISNFFEDHPTASSADAARTCNVSEIYAWRLLRADGQHTFHFTRVQELGPADPEARMQFCRWLLAGSRNILWTDESTFTRVGLFNIHNAHHWTQTNPHVVRPDHFQRRFSVNVNICRGLFFWVA